MHHGVSRIVAVPSPAPYTWALTRSLLDKGNAHLGVFCCLSGGDDYALSNNGDFSLCLNQDGDGLLWILSQNFLFIDGKHLEAKKHLEARNETGIFQQSGKGREDGCWSITTKWILLSCSSALRLAFSNR
jgi:hypothetical protein